MTAPQGAAHAAPGLVVSGSTSDEPSCQPCALVLFGVTGDLAARKVVPALLHLFAGGHLPEHFALVGFSRSAGSDDELRAALAEKLERHAPRLAAEVWPRFAEQVYAVAGSARDADDFGRLRSRLAELDGPCGTAGNRLFYLATPPSAFPPILEGLSRSGLVERAVVDRPDPWQRVVIEKPFGRDLGTARDLNELCHALLDESQLFRIDHYLGKETVQNILVFRFGNAIFEPLWNRNHVSHVEITVAEEIGVEGRGAFYEETGVLRDVVQNHLLQMLALSAMEAPVSFGATEVRNMKAQVLSALRPIGEAEVDELVVAGQYDGYAREDGVPEETRTATYSAITAFVDNWRWQGVPFYLRAGKGLATKRTEIAIHFRSIPFCLFGEERVCQLIEPNVLKMRIQPEEGISVRVASKVPGESQSVGSVDLDFSYAEAFDRKAPDAYERLLLDALRGDATLFARGDEVELSWRWLDPVLARFESGAGPAPEPYALGSEGPERARVLPARNGHRWTRLHP